MQLSTYLLLLAVCILAASTVRGETVAEELVRLTNDYREANGLSRIPMSYSLTKVATLHTLDLNANGGSSIVGSCNMHSWSNKGFSAWQGCCYDGTQEAAPCMWKKPKEITNGTFTGNGYENAAGGGGDLTASQALELWKKSTAHNNVILNLDIWQPLTWRSLGASVCSRYAVLWFSDSADPDQRSPSTLTCESVTLPVSNNNGTPQNGNTNNSGAPQNGNNLNSSAHLVVGSGFAFGLISSLIAFSF